MAVSTGTIRQVNPVLLAHVSGVTRVPRFAAPIAPVIRPQLLTTQLQGCDCCLPPNAGPVGMRGFIPPDWGSLRGLGKGEATIMPLYLRYGQGLRGLGKDEAALMPWYLRYGPGLRGLGLGQSNAEPLPVPSAGSGNTSILNSIAVGVSFIPVVGPIAAPVIAALGPLIKLIGKGRKEADIIVQSQNNMTAQLGTITQQFLTGTTPTADQLVSLYRAVWMLGVGFTEFVLQKTFTDRRASGQALNTIMPFIDGSCGYAVPLGMQAQPTQHNCMRWGAGTLGGDGNDGMLGALARAIRAAQGVVPAYPNLMDAANNGIPPQQSVAQGITPAFISGTSAAPLTAGLGGVSPLALIIGGVLLLMLLRR